MSAAWPSVKSRFSSKKMFQQQAFYVRLTCYRACMLHWALQFLNDFIFFCCVYYTVNITYKMYSLSPKFFFFCIQSSSICCCCVFLVSIILNSAVISCSKRRSRMLSSTLPLLSWQPLMSLQYTLAWWVNRHLILWYFYWEGGDGGKKKKEQVSAVCPRISFLFSVCLFPQEKSAAGSVLKVSIANNGTEFIL